MRTPTTSFIPEITSLICLAITGIALLGWALHIDVLTSILPKWPKMVPVTAVGLALGGTSLWLQARKHKASGRVGAVLGGAVLGLGAAISLFHFSGWAPSPFVITPSGRETPLSLSSPVTAVMFLATGTSLWLIAWDQTVRIAQTIALAMLLVMLLTVIGYLSQDTFLYQLLPGRGTSILTTTAFACLATCILSLRPSEGAMVAITGSTHSAKVARKLLMLALTTPIMLGVVSIIAIEAGLYDSNTAISFLVSGLVTLLTIVILRFALQLYRIDIARDRAEEEREGALLALRNADERRNEFLAMLAHELRNPLAPISTAAELLRLVQASDAEQVRRTSDIISRQVDHMVHLVDDLLDVSRVTRGFITLDKQPLDVKRIIADTVEQVQPLIRMKGHHLTIDLPSRDIYVQGDHKRLVQVFANLLNNAAKYTPEGGKILLQVRARDGQVETRVQDNGVGIDAYLLPNVFEIFTQGKRTADRSQGGLGLGLALVKSLLELHGGHVKAYSEGLKKGSCFTVVLPEIQRRHTETQEADGNRVAAKPRKALKIMVVDDNVDAADTLADLLASEGHEVYVEYGSESALKRAQIQEFDACLIDVGLPKLDGNETARRLRSMPVARRTLLVAITGYGHEANLNSSLAAGFDHYFVKPVNMQRLAGVLANINL